MTSRVMTRDTIAPAPGGAIVSNGRILRGDVSKPPSELRLSADRRPFGAPAADRVPAAGERGGEPPAGGRLRAVGEPQLELRPVAARASTLPQAVPALHGEVRAVLVSARRR